MSDLIDRKAAIDAIDKLHDKPNAWLECAVEAIEKLPSAQPELIQCKNCKHYGYYKCKLHGNNWMRSGDGFCDRAERKEHERSD